MNQAGGPRWPGIVLAGYACVGCNSEPPEGGGCNFDLERPAALPIEAEPSGCNSETIKRCVKLEFCTDGLCPDGVTPAQGEAWREYCNDRIFCECSFTEDEIATGTLAALMEVSDQAKGMTGGGSGDTSAGGAGTTPTQPGDGSCPELEACCRDMATESNQQICLDFIGKSMGVSCEMLLMSFPMCKPRDPNTARIRGAVQFLLFNDDTEMCCGSDIRAADSSIVRIFKDDGDGVLDPVSERCTGAVSKCGDAGADKLVSRSIGSRYGAEELEPGTYLIVGVEGDQTLNGRNITYSNENAACNPMPVIEVAAGDDIELDLVLDAQYRCVEHEN